MSSLTGTATAAAVAAKARAKVTKKRILSLSSSGLKYTYLNEGMERIGQASQMHFVRTGILPTPPRWASTDILEGNYFRRQQFKILCRVLSKRKQNSIFILYFCRHWTIRPNTQSVKVLRTYQLSPPLYFSNILSSTITCSLRIDEDQGLELLVKSTGPWTSHCLYRWKTSSIYG